MSVTTVQVQQAMNSNGNGAVLLCNGSATKPTDALFASLFKQREAEGAGAVTDLLLQPRFMASSAGELSPCQNTSTTSNSTSNGTTDSNAFFFVVRVCSSVATCAFARSATVQLDDVAPTIGLLSNGVASGFATEHRGCGETVQVNTSHAALTMLSAVTDDSGSPKVEEACIGTGEDDCSVQGWVTLDSAGGVTVTPGTATGSTSDTGANPGATTYLIPVSSGIPPNVPFVIHVRATDAAGNAAIQSTNCVIAQNRRLDVFNWTFEVHQNATFQSNDNQFPSPTDSGLGWTVQTQLTDWETDKTLTLDNRARVCAAFSLASASTCVENYTLAFVHSASGPTTPTATVADDRGFNTSLDLVRFREIANDRYALDATLLHGIQRRASNVGVNIQTSDLRPTGGKTSAQRRSNASSSPGNARILAAQIEHLGGVFHSTHGTLASSLTTGIASDIRGPLWGDPRPGRPAPFCLRSAYSQIECEQRSDDSIGDRQCCLKPFPTTLSTANKRNEPTVALSAASAVRS